MAPHNLSRQVGRPHLSCHARGLDNALHNYNDLNVLGEQRFSTHPPQRTVFSDAVDNLQTREPFVIDATVWLSITTIEDLRRVESEPYWTRHLFWQTGFLYSDQHCGTIRKKSKTLTLVVITQEFNKAFSAKTYLLPPSQECTLAVRRLTSLSQTAFLFR